MWGTKSCYLLFMLMLKPTVTKVYTLAPGCMKNVRPINTQSSNYTVLQNLKCAVEVEADTSKWKGIGCGIWGGIICWVGVEELRWACNRKANYSEIRTETCLMVCSVLVSVMIVPYFYFDMYLLYSCSQQILGNCCFIACQNRLWVEKYNV